MLCNDEVFSRAGPSAKTMTRIRPVHLRALDLRHPHHSVGGLGTTGCHDRHRKSGQCRGAAHHHSAEGLATSYAGTTSSFARAVAPSTTIRRGGAGAGAPIKVRPLAIVSRSSGTFHGGPVDADVDDFAQRPMEHLDELGKFAVPPRRYGATTRHRYRRRGRLRQRQPDGPGQAPRPVQAVHEVGFGVRLPMGSVRERRALGRAPASFRRWK